MNIEIKEAQELPTQIQTLAKHAAQEGFDFVHRLIEEWESGKKYEETVNYVKKLNK